MIKVAIKTVVILFSSFTFASNEFHISAHDYECLRHNSCKPIPHIDFPAIRGSSGGLEPFIRPSVPSKTDVNQVMRHTFNHIGDLALESEWLVIPHVFYTVKQLVSEARDIPFNSDGTADAMVGGVFPKRLVKNVSIPLHEGKVHHV